MGKIHRVSGFPIMIEKGEIARVLGYGSEEIPNRVQAIIREVEQAAPALITTAGAYRYMESEELERSEYLSCVDKAVLCLVTIGGGLEGAVEERKRKGDLSYALIMDSYGSAAAEAAAEAAEAVIRAEIEDRGLKCSTRFSPGYGDWNVAEQKWILPALEGETIGVTLTEGCMMVPRKSITFTVTYGTAEASLRDKGMCEDCELENCKFRRIDRKMS